jgi:hypothetical protein
MFGVAFEHLEQALGLAKNSVADGKPRGTDMKKTSANRRKGKQLTQKPLPAMLNLSKKGLGQPDLVEVIAAFRDEK